MRHGLLIFLLLLISIPAGAKSYICRSDGSIDSLNDGEEAQIFKPLKQHEIEEIPVIPKKKPAVKEKTPANSKSDFVPLTQKEVEER